MKIRARIEPKLKQKVERLFSRLGLSTTEAINLFYHQVVLCRGLPFEVRVFNEQTEQTFKDTDAGKNLKKLSSKEELLDDLGL